MGRKLIIAASVASAMLLVPVSASAKLDLSKYSPTAQESIFKYFPYEVQRNFLNNENCIESDDGTVKCTYSQALMDEYIKKYPTQDYIDAINRQRERESRVDSAGIELTQLCISYKIKSVCDIVNSN